MQRIDRVVGIALALLGLAVFWSARAFPVVPGQKVGAGFLPMIIAVGLAACGVALAVRSMRAAAYGAAAERPPERARTALVVVGIVAFYILAADRLGFLVVAPLGLLAALRSLGERWGPAVAWAVVGTLVIHVAFYKLLRVPLPWGLLRPLY